MHWCSSSSSPRQVTHCWQPTLHYCMPHRHHSVREVGHLTAPTGLLVAPWQWAVEVATIDGVRGAVASRDIQPGEHLLVIPTNITHVAKQAPALIPAVSGAQRCRDHCQQRHTGLCVPLCRQALHRSQGNLGSALTHDVANKHAIQWMHIPYGCTRVAD
jgi:hypothetical protein